MIEKTIFTFKVKSFRKMEPPISNSKINRYVTYAKINSIPTQIMENWSETNPRFQNEDTSVSRAIKWTLEDNNNDFHLLNKGIVFSAEKIDYDNSTGTLKLFFSDQKIHGNIDGGHTLKIISNNIKNGKIPSEEKYVFIEIMDGIKTNNELINIAASRNKTSQVTDATLANAIEAFEPLKKVLEKHYIGTHVAYKQNELQNSKKSIEKEEDLRTEITDIISILMIFNITMFELEPILKYPVQSYSSKGTILKKFLKIDTKEGGFKVDKNAIEEWVTNAENILLDILDLYDLIETELPRLLPDRKYGSFNFAGKNNNKKEYSLFSNNQIKYKVPDGIIKPILGAFRANIEIDKNDGKYNWKFDYKEIWEKSKLELAESFFNNIRQYSGENPNKFGKDLEIWKKLYQIVLSKIDSREKELLKKKIEEYENILLYK